jgi:arylsulfatase A-like enzyme
MAITFLDPDAALHDGSTQGYRDTTPKAIDDTVSADNRSYYVALKEVDRRIKLIVDGIKSTGDWANTILIFTADHGGREVDSSLKYSHGTNTATERRVPVIITGGSSRIIQGEFNRTAGTGNVMVYDLAPTIAKLFKLTPPSVWIGEPMPAFTYP